MRTPVRREILSRLEALNDQLQFFLFLENGFLASMKNFSSEALKLYTVDLFAANPYAPRIHRRLSEIPHVQDVTRAVTVSAFVATSYEVAATFFERAAKLSSLCGARVTAPGQRAPEQKYAATVVSIGWQPIPPEVIGLITYCRHWRNSFIHLHSVPEPSYAQFAADTGPSLNGRWAAAREKYDLAHAHVGHLTVADAIVLLKLLRIAVIALDEHLAASLDKVNITNFIAERTLGGEKLTINEVVIMKRVKKLASVVKQDFGFVPDSITLENAARRTGVR